MPNAQYFSARGCANDYAQYKCPMPHAPCPISNNKGLMINAENINVYNFGGGCGVGDRIAIAVWVW
ncbi:hypothetical protein, partial [Nostoc sp. 2RC]|uniref:hypothetical protein n=1 Tax=Nostoc sp. 2RC TaxID=2485484 RepID=UPI001C88FFAE